MMLMNRPIGTGATVQTSAAGKGYARYDDLRAEKFRLLVEDPFYICASEAARLKQASASRAQNQA